MANIVIIEDNPQTVRMVTRLLNKRGHTVEAFATGESGLLKVLDTPPHLLLIDLGLPDVDGQTIIAIIRQQANLASIPLIAFTSWPLDVARSMTSAYGCDGIITKPIDTRRFAEQIEAFLPANMLRHGEH
jgi:DNA-binding response OmpR family regulator